MEEIQPMVMQKSVSESRDESLLLSFLDNLDNRTTHAVIQIKSLTVELSFTISFF